MDRRLFLKGSAAAAATATIETRLNSVIASPEQQELPSNWPTTATEAANQWGGSADNWRLDAYLDSIGQITHNNVWIMERFSLLVSFDDDGIYTNSNGDLLQPNQIHDFDNPLAPVDVDLGEFNTNQAYGVAWKPNYNGTDCANEQDALLFGYGMVVFPQVEQVTIRPVATDPNQADRVLRETGVSLMQAIQNDSNISSIYIGVYSPTNQNFRMFNMMSILSE